MDGMSPQEIRRAALECAVNFTRQFNGSAPEDLLYAADIFAAYIESGSDAALRVDTERGRPRRSDPGPEPAPLPVAPPPRPAPEPDRRVLAAKERAQAARQEERKGDPAALAKVQKLRQARVEKLLSEWKVAKAPAHRNKLIAEMHESGLEDFVVDTGRGPIPLGQYMQVPQGS